jgi:WD40 repeat protein
MPCCRFLPLVSLLATALVALAVPSQPAPQDQYGDALPPGAFLRLGSQRLRHGGPIFCVAWSPDGKMVATGGGGADQTVRLWDAANGKEIRQFKNNQGAVGSLAFTPEGTKIVCLQQNSVLTTFEAVTGKTVRESMVDFFPLLPFTDDGKSFAAINENRQICLMDAATLKAVRVFAAEGDLNAKFTAFTLSKSGKLLVIADSRTKVRVFDAATGDLRHLLANTGVIDCASYSADGKLLATGGRSGTIQIWDAATGKLVRTIEGQAKANDVAWSPDGTVLAVGCTDNTIRLWDVEKGLEVLKVTSHRGQVKSVVFSPDGKRGASIGKGAENKVHIWDAGTGKEVFADDEHVGRVAALAALDNGKTLLTSCNDAKIRLWDLQTGKATGGFRSQHWRPRSIAVAEDGKVLATGNKDGSVHLLALPTGKLIKSFSAGPAAINAVAFSPSGKHLVTGSMKGQLLLWDLASEEILHEMMLPPFTGQEIVYAIAFSPDGKTVWTGSNEGTLRIWDAGTGQHKRELPGHESQIEWLVLSANGQFIASGSPGDSTVAVWEMATGKQLRRMVDPGVGSAVAFAGDGRMLATGGTDRDLRVWELATGKLRLHLEGHRGVVTAAAFLPDGNTLVSGSSDGTVLCWDLASRGQREPPPKALNQEQLEAEWQHLHGDNAKRSFQALVALTSAPEQALAKLQKELQPAMVFDPKLTAQYVADLNDPKFAVREKAVAELKKMRESAWPALQKVFANPPSLETQERARLLLGKKDDPMLPFPDRLRFIRSLELLERLSTPGASAFAQTLADGAPEAWITQEANRMLTRKKGRG